MNYLKLFKSSKSVPRGFNLLEIIFATVLVGVLAAIGIPNFTKSLRLSYLKSASSQVYQAISQAQATSTQRNEYWQVSFQVTAAGVVQYAVHQANIDPATTTVSWNSLPSQVTIDAETNIPQLNGIYQLCFTDQGLPSTVTGSGATHTCTVPPSFTSPQQITLDSTKPATYKRCVIIATLLGAFTTGEENSTANSNGKYCY